MPLDDSFLEPAPRAACMFHGFYLLLSLLALGVGPIAVRIAHRARSATVFLDAFVLVVVAGLVGIHVLPDSLALGGWMAAVAGVVGCVLPILAERGMRPARGSRQLTIVLALSGLAVHAMIDGAALAGVEFGADFHARGGAQHHGHSHGDGGAHLHGVDGEVQGVGHNLAIAWAVIAHRIPVAIGIWWIVGRTLGRGVAILTLTVTGVGTIVGWMLGAGLFSHASAQVAGVFQALLAGSLLHVLLHAHVPPPAGVSQRRLNFASVTGGLMAVAIVYAIEASHSHEVNGVSVGDAFMALLYETAPILLLAYLAAGLAAAFMPTRFIERLNRGSTLSQTLRGIAVGLPLPVCSCGVVPLYRGLIARGTAVAAAVGFLVATPELEIAAVLITMELIGPEFAIARVVAAAALALLVGVSIGALARRGQLVPPDPDAVLPIEDLAGQPLPQRVRGALRIGFADMVDQTAPWILLGLGIAAMLAPHLDATVFAGLPAWLDVPLAAAIGMPIYVCASGSTPLAAVFLAAGLSPGAGLAFLLTGPATNVTTFGVLRQLHGQRAALVFAAMALAGAIVLGYAVNALLPALSIPAEAAHVHGHEPSALQIASIVGLGLLIFGSLMRRGTRGFLESLFTAPHGSRADSEHAHGSGECGHDHAHP